MGWPYLFRRGWPRSYHWDAVHKVDDVDLPRRHSWVKRHPKNLGPSRSKEPGCMRSAPCFFNLDYGRKYGIDMFWKVSHSQFLCPSLLFSSLFPTFANFPSLPCGKTFHDSTSMQPVHRSWHNWSRDLVLLTTAKVSCSSASEKAGYFYRSQAMHSWCLQTLWIYLPFQSILWFELPIYLQINLLTIICKTWTTMSSQARSILRQIPWTKKTFKAPASKGSLIIETKVPSHLTIKTPES